MKNNASVPSGSIIGFLVREGTALIFAFLIWYVIWGGYAPTLETPKQAFRHAIIARMITLIYIGLQALAVVSAPLARETRYLLDLLVSLVPLALVGYAVAQSFSWQESRVRSQSDRSSSSPLPSPFRNLLPAENTHHSCIYRP